VAESERAGGGSGSESPLPLSQRHARDACAAPSRRGTRPMSAWRKLRIRDGGADGPLEKISALTMLRVSVFFHSCCAHLRNGAWFARGSARHVSAHGCLCSVMSDRGTLLETRGDGDGGGGGGGGYWTHSPRMSLITREKAMETWVQ
jgi:hypothetical protein